MKKNYFIYCFLFNFITIQHLFCIVENKQKGFFGFSADTIVANTISVPAIAGVTLLADYFLPKSIKSFCMHKHYSFPCIQTLKPWILLSLYLFFTYKGFYLSERLRKKISEQFLKKLLLLN